MATRGFLGRGHAKDRAHSQIGRLRSARAAAVAARRDSRNFPRIPMQVQVDERRRRVLSGGSQSEPFPPATRFQKQYTRRCPGCSGSRQSLKLCHGKQEL